MFCLGLSLTRGSGSEAHPYLFQHGLLAPATELHRHTETTWDFDLTRSGMGTEDQQWVIQLFRNSRILEISFESLGVRLNRSQISKIVVSYRESGTMRHVYLVTIYSANQDSPLVNFILKITRYTSSDENTVFHEVLSRLCNQALNRPVGYFGLLPDSTPHKKLVTTGPLYPGKTFEAWLNDYFLYYKLTGVTDRDIEIIQVAVIAEAVSIWKNLGQVFIQDAHPRQFMVDYLPSSQLKSVARLIDRGFIRQPEKGQVFLELQDNGEVMIGVKMEDQKILLTNVDRIREHILNRLPPVSESELITSLIHNLELYERPRVPRVDYGEEMEDKEGGRFPFRLDRKAIVEGITQALGRQGAGPFLIAYKKQVTQQKDEELERLIDQFLLEVTQNTESLLAAAL